MSVPAGPGTPSGPAGAGVVGVGVDAVDVDRFRRVLDRRPGIARRLFTEGERADATRSADAAPRLAARFAAKEATMKALGRGIGAFALRDVEVVRARATGSAAGAPSLRLGPGAAAVARDRRVDRWHLSMTHTAHLAVAVVVAERAGPG
ncbi:MAG: holo-ACP synthase [Acidimicrobiales bacterium]